MNVLLTGSTGFFGSHLAGALITEGYRVIALKRLSSNLRRLGDVEREIIFYDIEGLDLARPFTEQGQIHAVIHTATCYGRAGETATKVSETNTAFPLRLLEAASFFHTASFFNTDTILYPYLNAYALSKKHFVDWGRQFAVGNRSRFVNIRLQHLYGPGDDSSKFTTWVVQSCLNNLSEIHLTSGEQRRDFIYVTDAVSACILMLRRADELEQGFLEVGLGSGQAVTIREFVETVHRLTTSASHLSFGALPYRDNEPMESRGAIDRLLALGWQCRFSLEDGIATMIEDLRK